MSISRMGHVKVKKLVQHHDERGWLQEIMRCDDDHFVKFGQVYVTTTYKDVIKAWHLHKYQTDNICCIGGMIKLVLIEDLRDTNIISLNGDDSGICVREFFIGDMNPTLITIPPGIWHGWKAYTTTAVVVNVTDMAYNRSNPDEGRVPFNHFNDFYKWDLVHK